MNTTIDLKTAKTIDIMSQQISHMDNAVTDFFNKMSDVLERQLGDDEVYAAVIAPEIELTITPLANVRSYHELRSYAIDACTKKRLGFSERVCIDTFKSVRKEHAACTGTVQIRKGLGFPNKHFATQNLHLCARMHCLLQLCWF